MLRRTLPLESLRVFQPDMTPLLGPAADRCPGVAPHRAPRPPAATPPELPLGPAFVLPPTGVRKPEDDAQQAHAQDAKPACTGPYASSSPATHTGPPDRRAATPDDEPENEVAVALQLTAHAHHADAAPAPALPGRAPGVWPTTNGIGRTGLQPPALPARAAGPGETRALLIADSVLRDAGVLALSSTLATMCNDVAHQAGSLGPASVEIALDRYGFAGAQVALTLSGDHVSLRFRMCDSAQLKLLSSHVPRLQKELQSRLQPAREVSIRLAVLTDPDDDAHPARPG